MADDTKRDPIEEERLKLVAETKKLELESRELQTKIEILAIDKEKIAAERDKVAAEARTAVAAAAQAEIEANTKDMAFKEFLASNRYHHTIRFNEEVTDGTVDALIERLNIWHRNDPGCTIEIVFNSPGGSTVAGVELLDYLGELKQPWTEIKDDGT